MPPNGATHAAHANAHQLPSSEFFSPCRSETANARALSALCRHCCLPGLSRLPVRRSAPTPIPTGLLVWAANVNLPVANMRERVPLIRSHPGARNYGCACGHRKDGGHARCGGPVARRRRRGCAEITRPARRVHRDRLLHLAQWGAQPEAAYRIDRAQACAVRTAPSSVDG